MPRATPDTGQETGAPRLRGPWLWGSVAAGVVGVSLLRFAYVYLNDVASGDHGTLGIRAFEELTGLAAGMPFVLAFAALARRITPERVGWPRALAGALASFVAYSLLHTALLVLLRRTFGGALGFGDLQASPARFAYEGANDLLLLSGFTSAIWLVDAWLARRERERRAEALARELDAARLQNLRLQLQPHFLFNALNTISQAMYEDAPAADAMLHHLAELLRVSLRTEAEQEVPLREELTLLAHYEALMRARLGDRLQVEMHVAPDALDVMVPSLLLQPLVENAVRHGRVAREGAGRVVVRASLEGGVLALSVWDDGGIAGDADPLAATGTGLAATSRRLALLHGARARVEAGNSDGGFAVRLTLPARRSQAAIAEREAVPA